MTHDTLESITAVVPPERHLIGGSWVPAVGGDLLDVVDPATGDVVRRVPRSDARDVDNAVAAASEAFPAWRDLHPTRRADLLFAWADLCARDAELIDTIEAIEVGRPLWNVSVAAKVLRYAAGQADKILGITLPSTDEFSLGMTVREPLGVVASIIPWNAPTPLMATDVAPALAAGNTIVVKPSEDAPVACLRFAQLALEAGIPPGVVNVVTGYGHEAGAALAAHPGIRRLSFTGSPQTGTKVMQAAAVNHVPTHLELGGKSPQIVFADADLARAVPAIVGSLTFNAGQICAAGTRLLVDRRIHGEVVTAVRDAMAAVTVGHWQSGSRMGPLINDRQYRRVLDYIRSGQEQGAVLTLGGGRPASVDAERGFFVEPTLFDHVEQDMTIAQEEIFGPVLSVLPFDGEDEAIEIANGTPYGLVAAVWTSDVGRAVRVARRLESGQVTVNTSGTGGVIGAAHGGYKRSGFGRVLGPDAILDYTQTKTIVFDAHH